MSKYGPKKGTVMHRQKVITKPFTETLLDLGKCISETHGDDYGMCDELPLCYSSARHLLVFYGASVCLCDSAWEKYQAAQKGGKK